MANVLPCTISVGATATAVQLTGHHEEVMALNLGTAVVYARGDGSAAVVGADLNQAIPPYQGNPVEVELVPSGGSLAVDGGSPVTNLSMISTSGTALVHLYIDASD